MACRGRVIRPGTRPNDSGFTLLEVLAALAVLGIASGIFASLFIASMNLGHLNQSRSIATSLAEEQLILIRDNPKGFSWPKLSTLEVGQFGPVTLADPTGTGLASTDPPETMPFELPAFQRERNFYAQFSWEAHARLPQQDAGYVEIVVAIRWLEKGKPQSVTLTSAVPRSLVEGAS